MTKDEALKRMLEIANPHVLLPDYESRHLEADELLCQMLDEEGYMEVTEVFRNMKKWYA